MGASSEDGDWTLEVTFQFSPPRGGVLEASGAEVSQEISILAPAWGASEGNMASLIAEVISILAPAWGASLGKEEAVPVTPIFQFSPPRGGRPGPRYSKEAQHHISILAPAWGAS